MIIVYILGDASLFADGGRRPVGGDHQTNGHHPSSGGHRHGHRQAGWLAGQEYGLSDVRPRHALHRVCPCVYVYVGLYMYVCVCMRACIHACVHAYACICMCVRVLCLKKNNIIILLVHIILYIISCLYRRVRHGRGRPYSSLGSDPDGEDTMAVVIYSLYRRTIQPSLCLSAPAPGPSFSENTPPQASVLQVCGSRGPPASFDRTARTTYNVKALVWLQRVIPILTCTKFNTLHNTPFTYYIPYTCQARWIVYHSIYI